MPPGDLIIAAAPGGVGTLTALLIVGGFLVGIAGSVYKARWMTILGIGMIFLATLLLPVLEGLTDEDPAPQGERRLQDPEVVK